MNRESPEHGTEMLPTRPRVSASSDIKSKPIVTTDDGVGQGSVEIRGRF